MMDILTRAAAQQRKNIIRNVYGDAYIILSLRKVNPAYSGNCIRIRRSSDNTEQDIGFNTSGIVDTDAIASFVGSGSGFVKIWYDQSGNGKDFSQTTTSKQPVIRTSGTTESTDGFTAIKFTASSSQQLTRESRHDCNGLHGFAVYKKTSNGTNTDNDNRVFELSGTTNAAENDKVGWSQGLWGLTENYTVPTTNLKIKNSSSRVTAVKAGSYAAISGYLAHSGAPNYYATGYRAESLYCFTGYVLEIVITTKNTLRSFAYYNARAKSFYGL